MPRTKVLRRLEKGVCAIAGFFLFILGLRLIAKGAGDLDLAQFRIDGILHSLGFGWLMACIVLSGSPVAATALAFNARETVPGANHFDAYETFAMINGSRLGASFVVLLIGFIYDLRGRKGEKSVYVGVIALLTTLTTYLPAMLLGFVCLRYRLLAVVKPGWSGGIFDLLDHTFNPIVNPLHAWLHSFALAVVGVLVLLLAFKVFDRSLPDVDPTHGRIARMATVVYRPLITFSLGMLVTCVTLSVSVSISILVPLTAKGYVRRENLIPYIMGANITTWVDTLLASLILKSPDGFTVVLVEMLAGCLVSLPIILFAYGWYERIIDRMASGVTLTRGRLALFVAFFFLVPVVLWLL